MVSKKAGAAPLDELQRLDFEPGADADAMAAAEKPLLSSGAQIEAKAVRAAKQNTANPFVLSRIFSGVFFGHRLPNAWQAAHQAARRDFV